MTRKKHKGFLSMQERIALGLICLFHLTGLLLLLFSKGILYSLALDFVPINLIFTSLLVLKFQKEYNLRFWTFMGVATAGGFLAEIAGVNTGWIFGSYTYGEVLGPGIAGTPFLIGMNWFLLLYCSLCLSDFLPAPAWLRFFISVSLPVGLDYLMEPVATRLGFWHWNEGIIPAQNYVGWAALSLLLLIQPWLFSFQRKNRVAAVCLLIQALFFVLQN